MKQQRLLLDLANKLKSNKKTKDEILTSLINAGILDKSGKFTKNYPILAKIQNG